jgi:hypothetical protein
MVIPPEQFEPPLQRDPRRLSFRFLLSNSGMAAFEHRREPRITPPARARDERLRDIDFSAPYSSA